ncbi:MAG: hypothetical protein EU547_06095 [Promethearchaeota archaeon]|nr:MAG: hypothetical protein EU547_06095 [Candidatus Lokiarchaeota archaeon]
MKRTTQRIIAIVAIAAIAIGTGVGVFVYLQLGGAESRWITPGVSGIPSDQWIKVGAIGDRGTMQGDENYNGAYMAAKEINEAGGVEVDNKTYYVALISEDTDEAAADPAYEKGLSAANKLISVDKAEYIVGGFRTEAVNVYIEPIMDAKKMFFITGASTDSLCENLVGSGYLRYKYLFRVMPINSTSLGGQVINFLGFITTYINGSTAWDGETIDKAAIIREDIDFSVPMKNALDDYLPILSYIDPSFTQDLEIVGDWAYPLSAGPDEIAGYMEEIKQADADVIIPIISARGSDFMMESYVDKNVPAIVVGIDVPSQYYRMWDETNGDCKYETLSVPLTNTSKTSKSKAYYNGYIDEFEHVPLYTATGAYESVKILVNVINETQSFNNTKLIDKLESYDYSAGTAYEGASAHYEWNQHHDLVEGWPTGASLFAQWRDIDDDGNGEKVCVPCPGLYPSGYGVIPGDITEATYALPSWVSTAWKSPL